MQTVDLHSTADVTPHVGGIDAVAYGHGGAHGTALGGVHIRHHADAAVPQLLAVAHAKHLGVGLAVHRGGIYGGAIVFTNDFEHGGLLFAGLETNIHLIIAYFPSFVQ